MKKSILLLLAAVLSLGAESWANAPKPITVHYEAKLSSGCFGDMGIRKMWIKGDRMRFEYKCNLPLTLIRNSSGVFLIHPWQKIAVRYPKSWDRGNPNRYLPGPNGPVSEFLAAVKAKKQGRQTIDNQLCQVYSYTEPTTGRNCRLCVGLKSGTPVRLTLLGVKHKADTVTASYSRFELGTKMSDSLFDLPKGYAIRSMPAGKLSEAARAKNEHRKSG